MSESRSRWSELLGVPDDLRDPDLYQILGFERLGFEAAALEERFRERMQKIQAVRSTKHKEFVEFVKGELRRARRILSDERERAQYDRELLADRCQRLRRVLAPVLATGSLPRAAEHAALDEARRLGLTDAEAVAAMDEEIARTGARRGSAARVLTDTAGLSPDEAAAVAAAEAAELAKLAGAAASRALEAAREAEAARTRHQAVARLRAAPTDPDATAPEAAGEAPDEETVVAPRPAPGPDEETPAAPLATPAPEAAPPRRKKKKAGKKARGPEGPRTRAAERAPEPEPPEAAASEPAGQTAPVAAASEPADKKALKKSDAIAALQFCDRCRVSLPARWPKTGEAERVGVRLLCAACSAPVRAGEACAGCSRPTTEDDRLVSPAQTLRLCAACSRSTRRLKVCAGCQVILPPIAIERGEARSRGGQLYCAECLST